MARSISLAAYMAYARRATQAPPAPRQMRPEGELVWGHATDSTRAAALCQITERLSQQRAGVRMLLTLPPDAELPSEQKAAILCQNLPPDTVVASEAFLDHWRPDICLWTGGDLHPALLSCADNRGLPLFLLDAEEDLLTRSGWRWFPDLPRSLMDKFAQIQVQTEDTARFLRRIGVPDVDIMQTAALRPEAVPLPYNEDEREELATELRGRPLWLAANLHLDELDIVLEARRSVSRLAHRSLLIIVPHLETDTHLIQARLQQEDIPSAIWTEGDMPDENTQVILGVGREELGLWYSLAPVSFIGQSLLPGMKGCNPNEPAVHGTAILYGPNIRKFIGEYSRFAEARAARIVRDAETLAAAVQNLIAPDQAAKMANAAWDVASQGAEVTDRILDLLQDTLDVVGSN